ncbi:MAG: FGGY-family carbohydrate kinase [Anaerococcus obesiensis]
MQIKQMYAHGGVFKQKSYAKNCASALNTNVSIYKSASEGGCWGMACLAMYMDKR